MFIEEIMPECHSEKRYNFTTNKNCSLDLHIESNGNQLRVTVSDKSGLIEVSHLCKALNFHAGHKYHVQKTFHDYSNWFIIISWINSLHSPKSINRFKGKYISNIFDKLDRVEYKDYSEENKIS